MLRIFEPCVVIFFLASLCGNVNSLHRHRNVYQNREELVIDNVTSYNQFEFGRGVSKWKSVTVERRNYAVGLMPTGTCIFSTEMGPNGTVIFENATNTIYQFSDVELMKNWNSTTNNYEVIAVFISNAFNLEWFRIHNNLVLEKIWTWSLHKEITHINIFKFVNIYHLVVLKRQSFFTADLYKFTLSKYGKRFWLSETIPLEHETKTSTFNVYNSNYFLSIPQHEQVMIFKYENNRFIPFANVSSSNVDSLNSFNIGIRSYLLVNGQNSGIYRFNNYGVTKEEIDNVNLNDVNFWLPMHLTTYKEEIILLAQRILDHDDHNSKKIELISSSGNDFIVHDEIPCKYYGDNLSGIDCLVEEENHNNSINGSAVLLFGSMLGIVVPRKDAHSEFFLLHISTREIPNPIENRMEKLRATRKKLEEMMKQRKASIEEFAGSTASEGSKLNKTPPNGGESSASYDESKARSFEGTRDFKSKVYALKNNIDEVKAKLKTLIRKNTEKIVLKNVRVKNIIAIEGKTRSKDLQVDKIGNIDARQLITDFVRIGHDKSIPARKTFVKLDVERLDANYINGRNISNMCFKSDTITLKGILMIEQLAEVQRYVTTTSGMINDNMNLSQVLIIQESVGDEITFGNVKATTIKANIVNKLPIHNKHIADLEDNLDNLSEVQYDQLYMPGNVTVENINGDKLQTILNYVCLKNTNTTVTEKTILNGNIHVTSSIHVDYLNGLKFPEEYVFDDSDSDTNFIKFSGNKSFKNEITASELTSQENIGGIDTSTVVTLSENQTIPGLFTFTNLNVLGGLVVNGTITGVPDVVPNPTIKETKTVGADVNFKVLEIEGLLTIGNSVNQTHLEQILEDVVLKDEKDVIITAIKYFKEGLTVSGNAKINSNSISGIPLDSLIDKTSEQTLNINFLNGNVIFENLLLAGHFGGINITQLDGESVKLSGEQFISSKIHFTEETDIENLKIKESLNGINPDSYIYKTGDRFLPSLSILDKVDVDQISVEGNFTGAIGNFDIEEFNEKRLSLTKDQLITATYMVDDMYVDNLKATAINDYNYVDLTNSGRYHTLLLNRILENNVKINELRIVGDLKLRKIDGILMDDVIKLCPYQGENKLQSNISFRDDVEFNEVTIENLNGIPFGSFIQNLVFKNETNIIFDGPAYFAEGFEVNQFMEASSINEIPIENILRKTSDQKLLGPLVIKGNVSVESDTIVAGNLNGVSIKRIAEVFESIGTDTFKINGDVEFEKHAYVDDLVVYGWVNNKNLSKFFKEIVHSGDDIVVPGITNFKNKVEIKGNLGVMERINNIDLSKFAHDLVYITNDTYIQGLISFEQPVHIKDELVVESDILCESVMDIDIRDWRKNAVFVNRGFIPGNLRFKSVTILDSVRTSFINSINMSAIIPLRTDQYIPEGLYFREMSSNREIKVKNLVNGIKLEPEFRNTLLNKDGQEVYSEIEFTNNVVVHENLEADGLVNSIDFNKIVTIHTDQNLTADYSFEEEIISSSDLIVYGVVNDINITEWNSTGLKKKSQYVQTIESSLNIAKNLTFENNVTSTGLISDLDFVKLAIELQKRDVFKESTERELIVGYSQMCENVNYLLGRAKSQMYKFKYFDYFQFINFDSDINIVHHFEYGKVHYMLVNEKTTCKSHIYSWSVSGFSLVKNGIQTGIVSQFITVRDKNDSLYLVGRSDEYATQCSIEGTNVWKVEDVEEILHQHNLENFRLLHESKIPGTFYGVASEFVYEFNIKSYADPSLRILRKWKIESSENLAFMPYGLGTGLALRDKHKILKLTKQKAFSNESSYVYDHTYEEIVVEDVIEELNYFIPGGYDSEFIVVNVGKPRTRPISAITTYEEASIRGKYDLIKIYDDILEGKLFTKIPAYRPSSLLSVEFGKNGETLLVFFEDEELIQIYEYKGMEGFKLHSSIKEQGQQLIGMPLPFPSRNKIRNALVVVNRNKLTIMETIMDGYSINEEGLQCTLPNL